MTSRVSVLICTAGRPELLDRAIESLVRGTRVPDQLVVVNGGDDEANQVVARHAPSFPEVVLLQYPNRNLAASRNLGLPHCRGEIVAMTDDDAVVSPGWLEAMVRVHEEDPATGAIGGPVEGAGGDRWLSRVADLVVFPHFDSRRRVRTLPGVNVSYKRAALEAAGPYDESLFRGEDVDLNWRMVRQGAHLLYDPAVSVRHAHRASILGLLEQQWMYGRAYVRVRRKWPDLYSVYPRRLRSPRDYAKLAYCVLAIILHPLGVARRMDTLTGAASAYPLLVAHHVAWKLGMLWQAWLDRRSPPHLSGNAEPPVVQVHRWESGALCG